MQYTSTVCRFPHVRFYTRVNFKLYVLRVIPIYVYNMYIVYCNNIIICICVRSTIRRVVFKIYRYPIRYNNIRIARNRVLRVQMLRKDNTNSIIYPFTTVRRTPTTRYTIIHKRIALKTMTHFFSSVD